MIKLSLIIAVYNAKKTIRHVVETAKLVPEIKEIIVVDDGSTDGSRDVIRTIAGIRRLYHKANFGKGRTIVDGLKSAKHDTVLLIDDDLRSLGVHHIRALIYT